MGGLITLIRTHLNDALVHARLPLVAFALGLRGRGAVPLHALLQRLQRASRGAGRLCFGDKTGRKRQGPLAVTTPSIRKRFGVKTSRFGAPDLLRETRVEVPPAAPWGRDRHLVTSREVRQRVARTPISLGLSPKGVRLSPGGGGRSRGSSGRPCAAASSAGSRPCESPKWTQSPLFAHGRRRPPSFHQKHQNRAVWPQKRGDSGQC